MIFSNSFQIIGGFILLFEIKSKINSILKKNISTICKEWASSNPFFLKPKQITSSFDCVAKSRFESFGIKKENHNKIEDKVKYLEERLYKLEDKLNEQYKDLSNFIDSTESRLMARIGKNYIEAKTSENEIKEALTNGVKNEILGILLVIYGLSIQIFF